MSTLHRKDDADPFAVARLTRYLENRGDLDPNAYAPSSFVRRLKARRDAAGVHDWDSYRARLEADPDEYATLLRSIAVHRTALFRDPDCWSALQEVLAERMRTRRLSTFTIWCAGCATGEEAYSLAATALLASSGMAAPPTVSVLATDASASVLVTAKEGRVPAWRVRAIPDEARPYFHDEGRLFSVSTELRRRIQFQQHDLLKAPPFAGIDLIACRNTLMYFSVDAQCRVLEGFAGALGASGLLFTGLAELPTVWTRSFEAEQLTSRIWRKTKSQDELYRLRIEDS